ncbi:Adenylate/guanylate cyclase [Hoyosella subflava DQS3-9A1]|uniref:Adenylate/guanylate cyclase n=2 Tax=Hoyosella TaxID=697025 RepID=F6EIE8_HOYSD|nr:Adenylate/guanylate cyclase [Hoyosella subflava DQS3-9A1]
MEQMNDGMPPGGGQAMLHRLLGASQGMTLAELSDAAGVTAEQALRLWRALGFAEPAADEQVFTSADVQALAILARLEAGAKPGEDLSSSLLRALGHHMSRLASWQVIAMEDRAARRNEAGAAESVRTAMDFIADHINDLDSIVLYAWRRQLSAIAAWRLGRMSEDAQKLPLTVGFADMVSFTSLVRTLSADELARLVTRFELVAMDIVLRNRGRVIKMIGDAILFAADSPGQGADIATQLSAAISGQNDLPDVRVGMATGEVVSRLGDIFGQPVNVASRLTEQADPGTVLVDEATAAAVEQTDMYTAKTCARRNIRGVGVVTPSVLARTVPGGCE